jgi:hypothetical protein
MQVEKTGLLIMMEVIQYSLSHFNHPELSVLFIPANSYYESNNIPVTTAASASLAIASVSPLPAEDEFIISYIRFVRYI